MGTYSDKLVGRYPRQGQETGNCRIVPLRTLPTLGHFLQRILQSRQLTDEMQDPTSTISGLTLHDQQRLQQCVHGLTSPRHPAFREERIESVVSSI